MVDNIDIKKALPVVLICVLALGLRLAYVGSISRTPIDKESDEEAYDAIGLNMATGKGYVDIDGKPTSIRSPLTPALCALVYRIAGHNVTAVRTVQAFIGTLMCFAIYLLGKEVFSEKIGLVSAAIAAAYPAFIFYCGKLYLETTLVFLITLSVYILVRKNTKRPAVNYFLAGASFGLAALTRPSILWLPFFILIICHRMAVFTKKDLLKKIIILIVGMSIVIAPWTIRNYIVHKRIIIISTQFGVFFLASYLYPEKGFGFVDWDLVEKITKGARDESERGKIAAEYTWRKIREDPWRFIKLMPLKFLWLWEPFDGSDYGFGSAYNIVYGATFMLFLFGLFGSYSMRRRLLPLYAVIGYFILLSVLSYSERRFRLQIEPLVIIFAAYGALWVAGRVARDRIVASLFIAGLLLNLLLFFAVDDAKRFSRRVANAFGYNAFPKQG